MGNQAPTPWTATITLFWRPTARAYNSRTALLITLEEQKRLRAFYVRDEVGHALVDEHTELAIGVNYFSVAFADGVPEGAVLPSLFDPVLDAVKPRITSLNVRLQHLCPLSVSDFAQAKGNAAKAVLSSLIPPLEVNDFAILIDGTSNGKAEYQTEFGIVNKSEAVARLTQAMGRLKSPDEPDFTHINWADRNLPEIALYADSRWRNREALSSATSEALHSCVTNYYKDANELVRVLLERVGGPDATLKVRS